MSELFTYEGTFRFASDKRLTQDQVDQLSDIIALQIIEPVNIENEEEDYSTSKANVSLNLVLWNCGLCGAEILRAKDLRIFDPWGETCLACTEKIRGGQK